MDWTPKTIEAEVLRILEQGAAAARRVVDGYLAQRTPERDAHWICTQMAKEFGAIAMHTDRVKGAIMQGRPAREIDEMVDTVKEEVAHYQGYRMVLERLVGDADYPLPEMFNYLLLDIDEQGMRFNKCMLPHAAQWPEHHKYVQDALDLFKQLDPWSAQMVSATFEGGAAGWHYVMSELPADDDFLKGAAQVQRGIALDELHHGPDEIREIVERWTPELGVDLDRLFRVLREMRYQEMRQRNEQFLHPLTEAEMDELRQLLVEDRIEPMNLYSQAA